MLIKSCIQRELDKFYKEIQINANCKNDEKSVLFIANHFSWWDGFLAEWVNQRIFQKRYHVMMLEKELEKRKFLSQTGAFSIQPNSKSSIESLKFAAQLLSDSGNWLTFFPQGKIQSIYRTDFEFLRGFEYIYKFRHNQFRIVMAAYFVDFLIGLRPKLNVYLKDFEPETEGLYALEKQYNDFYQQCLSKQKTLEQ